MKNNFSFPYRYYYLPRIGKVFSPIIPVKLRTIKGLVEFEFIVDTGADLTTLPLYMATQLGIDLSGLPKSTASGLGGAKVKTWLAKIELIFPKTAITVRVSITNENSTPLLLGRVDFLSLRYGWNFNSKDEKIIFEKV